MSLCAFCGMQLAGAGALCSHHVYPGGEDWTAANRMMCDLLHRGIRAVPPAVAARDTCCCGGTHEECVRPPADILPAAA